MHVTHHLNTRLRPDSLREVKRRRTFHMETNNMLQQTFGPTSVGTY